MRLRLRHKLGYVFPEPARNITRILRLTPRSFEGQHVVNWQIDIDVDCVLKAGEDGFSNITHSFTAKGPCEALTITVVGEVDNFDAAGVVRGLAERMPVELYLRDTVQTTANDALRAFAQDRTRADATRLGKLHGLQEELHAALAFDPRGTPAETAAAAFAAGSGTGSDFAHIFVACARHLGIPARVASGYYLEPGRENGIVHAWAEAFVDGLGWTGFDAAHKVCPQDRHIRLAAGLDHLAAGPIRGVQYETVEEALDLRAPFGSSWDQSQSQGPGWQRQSQGGQSQQQG